MDWLRTVHLRAGFIFRFIQHDRHWSVFDNIVARQAAFKIGSLRA
jgi:hypothetical protein